MKGCLRVFVCGWKAHRWKTDVKEGKKKNKKMKCAWKL